MMSDEMGGQVLRYSADIAKTGVEIVSALIGGAFSATGSTMEMFLRLHLARKERELQERNSNPLSRLKMGRNSEVELYKSGQEPCVYGNLSVSEAKKFNKYAKRWGVCFSGIKSNDGTLSIIGLPSQSDRVAMALKELRDDIAKENLLENGFTEKDINETFYGEYGGKGKLFEDNKYNGLSLEGSNSFSYKSDNSTIWDEVAKECGIELDENSSQSKKENFISNLEDSIEQSIGADELGSNYINMPGRGLVYIDSRKNAASNEIEYRAISVRYIDGKIEKSKILTEAELKETQQYMQHYNNREKTIENRIASYGDFSETQKSIVKKMWQGDYDYKNNQTIDYSGKYNISQLAKTNYSPRKLVALFTCMREFYNLPQEEIDKNMNVITSDAYSAEQINSLREIALDKGDIAKIADINLDVANYEAMHRMIVNENKVNEDIELKLNTIDKYIADDIACIGSDIEIKRENVLGSNEYTFYRKNENGVFEVSRVNVSEKEYEKIWLNELSDRIREAELKENVKCVELPDGNNIEILLQEDGTYDAKINGNIIFEAIEAKKLTEKVWNIFSQRITFDGDKKMSLYGYEVEQNGEQYNVIHSINGEKKVIADNISKNEIKDVLLSERKKAFNIMIDNYKAQEIQNNIEIKRENIEEKSIIEKIKEAINKGDRVSSEKLMTEFFEAIEGNKDKTAIQMNVQQVEEIGNEEQEDKDNEIQKKAETYEKRENVKYNIDDFIRGTNEFTGLSDANLAKTAYQNAEKLGNDKEGFNKYLDTMSLMYDDKKGTLRYSPMNTLLISLQAKEAKNVVSRLYAEKFEVPDDALKVNLSYPVPYGKNSDAALQDVKEGTSNIGKYNIENRDNKYYVSINTESDGRKMLLSDADEKQLKEFFDEVKIEKECVSYKADYVYAVNNTGKAEFELTDKQREALGKQINEYKESMKGTKFEKLSDSVGYAVSQRYGERTAKVNPPENLSFKDFKVIHNEFGKLSQKCDIVLFKQKSLDLGKKLGKELITEKSSR